MKSSAARAVLGEDDAHRRLDLFDGQRRRSADVASRSELARGVHRRLGGALRAAHAGELGLGLHAAAVVEELAVDRQLDAVRAQVVGEPERERLGTTALVMPSASTARSASSARISAVGRPEREQLVDPELLRRVQLEEAELGEARRLHRADRRCASTPSFSA